MPRLSAYVVVMVRRSRFIHAGFRADTLLRARTEHPHSQAEQLERGRPSQVADFNRNQTQPTPLQLQRVRSLFAAKASEMPKQTADLLQFILWTE